MGGLIERYTELAPEVAIIRYRPGYQGLLAAVTALALSRPKLSWARATSPAHTAPPHPSDQTHAGVATRAHRVSTRHL